MGVKKGLFIVMNFYSSIFEQELGFFIFRVLRFPFSLPRRIYRALRIDHFRYRNAPRYKNPSQSELVEIEQYLSDLKVSLEEIQLEPEDFKRWRERNLFPENYHGGKSGNVYDEKLLEHWISYCLLGLDSYGPEDVFVDTAAGNSPWAKILREQFNVKAYAIDLEKPNIKFRGKDYYLIGDATKSDFDSNSIKGMALHCSYEMFGHESDIELIDEIARVLKPGGKAIILPFYMHTHYCAYSTPEFYGTKAFDSEIKEYINLDYYGVPFSRKYDPTTFIDRVVGRIGMNNLKYSLKVLRGKQHFGKNIYCHFVLEITKPSFKAR